MPNILEVHFRHGACWPEQIQSGGTCQPFRRTSRAGRTFWFWFCSGAQIDEAKTRYTKLVAIDGARTEQPTIGQRTPKAKGGRGSLVKAILKRGAVQRTTSARPPIRIRVVPFGTCMRNPTSCRFSIGFKMHNMCRGLPLRLNVVVKSSMLVKLKLDSSFAFQARRVPRGPRFMGSRARERCRDFAPFQTARLEMPPSVFGV